MDRRHATFLIALSIGILICTVSANENLSHDDILKRIVQKAKENEEEANRIGFYQVTAVKKVNDGKVSDQKVRLHRLTWIDDMPYLELLEVNGAEPNGKEKKEEAQRRAKFIRSLREKEKDDDEEDDLTWDEMYNKYNFEPMPADTFAQYVYTFKPKPGKLPERSRTEKVLNHIAGKFWADENFNIVRAEAKLLENVRFGLGILGKIEKLEMKFEQQTFERIHVPSYSYIHFKARIAMVKTEERTIEATYKDYFRR